jgi:hypothetical protein
VKPVALYYLGLLDTLRAAARGLGYALALHGSLQRDLDLVAVPWAKGARPAEDLVRAVALAAGGACHLPDVCRKPHGRRAWVIHLDHKKAGTSAYIDLSVMPRRAR